MTHARPRSTRVARLGAGALAALCVLGLTACGTPRGYKDGVFKNEVVHYKAAAPAGFEQLKVDGADVAFMHKTGTASLLYNSQCEAVGDVPLTALRQHLLIGLTDRTMVKADEIMLGGRAALDSEVHARLDGVPVALRILVLKRDSCVYDVVLTTPQADAGAFDATWQTVRGGFDVRTRPDLEARKAAAQRGATP